MLFAMHCDALKEVLLTPDNECNVFFRSKIAVTKKILDEYNAKIASDPISANYYYPFFQHISNKLKIIETQEQPQNQSQTILSDYFVAAQYGGKNLTISNTAQLHAQDIATCSNAGIRIKKTADILSDPGKIGYEPFEKHKLLHGNSNPPTEIEVFFKNENHIVFYDKFINNHSISLINHLIGKTSKTSKSIIVTSSKACLTPAQIKGKIKSLPTQKVRIELADNKTAAMLHDRFIYIDRHYELHFPRGLDIFGSPPNWQNQNSTIDIYDVYKCGTNITISFEKNGGTTPSPITLRSIVNG